MSWWKIVAGLLLGASWAEAQALPIGKPVFQVLQQSQRQHAGFLTEGDAPALRAALLADQALDEQEKALLHALTEPRLRSLLVTCDSQKLVFYSSSGELRNQLEQVLTAPLQARFREGGYAAVLNEPNSDVTLMLRQGLAQAWKESSRDNAYKPFRDALGTLYTASNQCGPDTERARLCLFQAAEQLDQAEQDRIPDFLYRWVVPKRD